MSIRNTRSQGTSGIAEGRFIRKVLQGQGEEILSSQDRKMSRFSSPDWFEKRGIKADESKLAITELKKHRFIDMRTCRTRSGGKKKKKNYPIYNKIMFGHLNNIVRELSFGYTEEVMQEMKKLEE